MRKIFRQAILGRVCLGLGLFLIVAASQAQTVLSTIPTFTASNGSGIATFNLQNTNPYPIRITDVSTVLNATGSAGAVLWTNPIPINGTPSVISVANGWTPAASDTVISTIGATANTTEEPVLTNISVVIPANTTIGVAVSVFTATGTGRMRYTDIATGTNPTFTAGGLTLLTGNLIGYGGTSLTGAPTNHPRGFVGSLTFESVVEGMNNAAVNSLVSPIQFCAGNQSIAVNIANSGHNLINTVDVYWELDGVPQPVVNYTTPIDTIGSVSGGVASVTLGNYTFTNAPVNLTVYTSNPNGVADTLTGNDTLHVTLQAAMGGIYTINSNQATGGTNYASFADFTSDLATLGICSPVVANVDPASGPYNEVVRFGTIVGSSATNTIRINGNGRTVEYSNTTTTANNDRQLLIVDGTSYLTIDSLVFKTLNTVGWGAVYTNSASYDTITNCTFDFSSITTTAAASSSGIAFSGSTTSATTASSGVNHCYVGGNRLLGPTGSGGYYYGITLINADSNVVENNELSNFYLYGIYVNNSAGVQVLDNEIHRTTKTTASSFYGVHTAGTTYGAYINGNRIHTPAGAAASSSSLVYALNITGEGSQQFPALISNNLVYNINDGGTLYGIQVNAAPYNKIYHNTVVFDQVMTGTSVNRGIYATGTNTGVEIKNNIVSITAGSGGVKTGLFYNAANSVDDSQRNNVYVNSSQAGNQFYAAYPAASTFATMADFQLANPSLEGGSLDTDPVFTNVSTANFLPTNGLLGVNGVNLLADVPADITGAVRKPTPTPGAFEVPAVQGVDAALLSFQSPSATFCAGEQAIDVVLANYGSLTVSNFSVYWEINGVPQTPYTYAGTLDTINGSGAYNDTVTIGTPTLVAGANDIKVWLSVAGDQSALNDTIVASFSPSNFVVSTTNDTICLGNEASLSLAPNTGYGSATISWESSADGVTFTPIANANNFDYTTPTLTDSAFYRVFINSGTNGCYSNVQNIQVTDVHVLNTTGGSRCGTGTVDLSATASTGSSIQWFANATGGAPLGSGSNFTTPSITATTTFYAAAVSNGGIDEYVPSPTAGTSTFITTTVGWGLHFVVNTDVTINTVDTYPVNTSGAGPASIQIKITDITDAVLYTGPVHNFTSSTSPALETIPVDITLPPGTYKMGMTYTGLNNMVRESSGSSFPYTAPSNALAITAGANGSGTAQTTSSYYWFYNWKISQGCQSTRVPVEAEVIPAPVVQISPSTTTSVCIGDSTMLSFTPEVDVTYQWKINGGDIPNATGSSYYVSTAGSYTVEATNTLTNCSALSAAVQVNVLDPQAAISAAGPSSFCDGGNVVLSTPTSGTYLYQWALDSVNISPGGNLPTYTATQSGNYTVTITQLGCVKQSAPFMVTVNPLPTATITPSNPVVCENESVDLQANAGTGFTYQWQESGIDIAGAQSGTYTATLPGTYTVIVTDANSCIQTSAGSTVSYNTSPIPVITVNGLVLSTDANYTSYQWYLNGSIIPGANQAQYTATENGNYTVEVTDANNCSGESVGSLVYTVSISENDMENGISVFPNPTSGVLQITYASSVNVELISVDGKVLMAQTNVKTIDISTFADNVYILKITDSEGKLVAKRKIIKITK